MKKCPFCKAEIEENARFCLYCMKPLTKKEVVAPARKKAAWWLPVLLVLLLLLLGAALLFGRQRALPQTPEATGESTGATTLPATTEVPEETTAPVSDTLPAETDPPETTAPTEPAATEPPETQPAETRPRAEKPEATEPEVTEPEVTEPEVTEPPATEPEEDVPETTAPQGPVYLYRAARTGDDFAAHYTNAGNDIVIIGVGTQAADGVYNIPSTIDGKRVIAIMANAFTGTNARTVYLPASVRTVWNYAFAGCALRHIYLRGSSVYLESKAFPDSAGILTIHCAADCDDRAFRYYKNSAENYGATWKEWNG